MQDLKAEDYGHQAQQKDLSPTLVSHDANYASRTVSNKEE